MCVNHSFKDRVEVPKPPTNADFGRLLATFSRGPFSELRVSLEEPDRWPVLVLRRWTRSRDDDAWWPIRSTGIRQCEACDLASLLVRFAEDDLGPAPDARVAGTRLASRVLPYGDHRDFLAECDDVEFGEFDEPDEPVGDGPRATG